MFCHEHKFAYLKLNWEHVAKWMGHWFQFTVLVMCRSVRQTLYCTLPRCTQVPSAQIKGWVNSCRRTIGTHFARGKVNDQVNILHRCSDLKMNTFIFYLSPLNLINQINVGHSLWVIISIHSLRFDPNHLQLYIIHYLVSISFHSIAYLYS